jgi:hypothetical protein
MWGWADAVEIIMKNLIPRHIQEAESDRRSIKEGWYATNKTGQICSGRFPDRADCQAHIALQVARAARDQRAAQPRGIFGEASIDGRVRNP